MTPLELFFDLVFVLAITQCTALMAHEPTWEGLAKGLLVLGDAVVGVGRLRLADSVVDPEEGAVRIAIFAAMAALLVVSLCVRRPSATTALVFAVAYGVVRVAHIVAVPCSPAATIPTSARRRTARGQHRDRRRRCSSSPRPRRRRQGASGSLRCSSTWAGRYCFGAEAGSSPAATSPSATG